MMNEIKAKLSEHEPPFKFEIGGHVDDKGEMVLDYVAMIPISGDDEITEEIRKSFEDLGPAHVGERPRAPGWE